MPDSTTAPALGAYLYVVARFGKPDPSWLANGMLAGLVAITAPCAFVNSLGAAIIADALQNKRPFSLIDVLPASIRTIGPDGLTKVVLNRGTRLPASAELEVVGDEVVDLASAFLAPDALETHPARREARRVSRRISMRGHSSGAYARPGRVRIAIFAPSDVGSRPEARAAGRRSGWSALAVARAPRA